MYELIVVACLLAHPARCDEFPVPFQEPMGMAKCLREGQLHLAEWVAVHPDWVIRRWTCGLPKA